MALPLFLQWSLGRVSGLDPLGGIRRDELGDESGGDGGFGELFEEG